MYFSLAELIFRAIAMGARMINRKVGVIKKYFPKKKYGFIEVSNNINYFFHVSDFRNSSPPRYGDWVIFSIGQNRKAPCATKIRRLTWVDKFCNSTSRISAGNYSYVKKTSAKINFRGSEYFGEAEFDHQDLWLQWSITHFFFCKSEDSVRRKLSQIQRVTLIDGLTGVRGIEIFGGGPKILILRPTFLGNRGFSEFAYSLKHFIR